MVEEELVGVALVTDMAGRTERSKTFELVHCSEVSGE